MELYLEVVEEGPCQAGVDQVRSRVVHYDAVPYIAS